MEKVAAAAASSSEREQVGGGNSTKVEAGKAVEVHLANWVSMEFREEVHEKIQRKMRYLLWDLSKEEMEEQFNGEAKEGWRFAADATRITDETASSKDRKHTSGEVFVAADSNLGAVVGGEGGPVASIQGNEGRITQAW